MADVDPSSDALVLFTRGEDETFAIGRKIAGVMRGGERIGLSGELGAGKTCLVRGLADGLGIAPEKVHSPSFALVLPYEGGRLPLYHIDLFRLRLGRVDRLALREYMYGDGVCAIEWFEHFGESLGDYLEICLTFVEAQTRRLVAVSHGVGYNYTLNLLRKS